jgi:hypothetical protein
VTAQPAHWDPVTLTPDGDDVVMGCTVCGAAETVSMDPTAGLLVAIDGFVAAHAACD